jgi:hypothetical protein
MLPTSIHLSEAGFAISLFFSFKDEQGLTVGQSSLSRFNHPEI